MGPVPFVFWQGDTAAMHSWNSILFNAAISQRIIKQLIALLLLSDEDKVSKTEWHMLVKGQRVVCLCKKLYSISQSNHITCDLHLMRIISLFLTSATNNSP